MLVSECIKMVQMIRHNTGFPHTHTHTRTVTVHSVHPSSAVCHFHRCVPDRRRCRLGRQSRSFNSHDACLHPAHTHQCFVNTSFSLSALASLKGAVLRPRKPYTTVNRVHSTQRRPANTSTHFRAPIPPPHQRAPNLRSHVGVHRPETWYVIFKIPVGVYLMNPLSLKHVGVSLPSFPARCQHTHTHARGCIWWDLKGGGALPMRRNRVHGACAWVRVCACGACGLNDPHCWGWGEMIWTGTGAQCLRNASARKWYDIILCEKTVRNGVGRGGRAAGEWNRVLVSNIITQMRVHMCARRARRGEHKRRPRRRGKYV